MKIKKLSNSDIIKLFAGVVLLIIVIFFGVISLIVNKTSDNVLNNELTSNVRFENNKQIIDIASGGGFEPEITVAKAGMDTILKFKNNGQIDCSSSVDLPELGIKNEIIALGGTNEYEIKDPKSGEFKGSCSMGMYDFRINFK